VPNPPEVERTNEALAEDPTVYGHMNGPNEFHVTGTMKDWTIVDRLHLGEERDLYMRVIADFLDE